MNKVWKNVIIIGSIIAIVGVIYGVCEAHYTKSYKLEYFVDGDRVTKRNTKVAKIDVLPANYSVDSIEDNKYFIYPWQTNKDEIVGYLNGLNYTFPARPFGVDKDTKFYSEATCIENLYYLNFSQKYFGCGGILPTTPVALAFNPIEKNYEMYIAETKYSIETNEPGWGIMCDFSDTIGKDSGTCSYSISLYS